MPQYYQTNSVSYGATQAGATVAGVWTEGDFAATQSVPGGITFTLHTSFDPVRGLPLDPPVWHSLTLTLERTLINGAGPLKLYARPTGAPALWSTANPPSTTGATLVATVTGSDLGTLTFPIDLTVMRSWLAHSSWRGRLALVLVHDDVGFSTITAASLSLATLQVPFTTGINTPDIQRAGRIRTCQRTGRLAFADEFVRDGYIEGAWVHADSFDPEDRADDYVLPSSEGTVNDEVP